MLLRLLWIMSFLTGFAVVAQTGNTPGQKVSLNFLPESNALEVQQIIEIPFAANAPQPMIQLQLPQTEQNATDDHLFVYRFNHIEVNQKVLNAFFLAESIPAGATLAIRLEQPLFPGEWFKLTLHYEISLPQSNDMAMPGQGTDYAYLHNWLAQLLPTDKDKPAIHATQITATLPEEWRLLTPGFLHIKAPTISSGTWAINGFANSMPLLLLRAWPQRNAQVTVAQTPNIQARWLVSTPEFDVDTLTQELAGLLEQHSMQKHHQQLHGIVLPATHVAAQQGLRRAGFLVYSADTQLDLVDTPGLEIVAPLSAYLWRAPGRIEPRLADEWQAFWTQLALQKPLHETLPRLQPLLLDLLVPDLQPDKSWRTRIGDIGIFAANWVSPQVSRAKVETDGLALLSIQRSVGDAVFARWMQDLQVQKHTGPAYLDIPYIKSIESPVAAWMPFLQSCLQAKAQGLSLQDWQQAESSFAVSFRQQGLEGAFIEVALFLEDGSKQILKHQVTETYARLQSEVSAPVVGMVIDPEFKLPVLISLERVHSFQAPDRQSNLRLNVRRSGQMQHVIQWLLGGL